MYNKNYLTEDSLEEFLKQIYPNKEIIRNKIVPNSNLKSRLDFRIEEEKLIVEFDGYRHYNSYETQLRDEIKYHHYTYMGYKVIRIPYFIQLSIEVILKLFDIHLPDFEQKYPHGFIDKKALTPLDFNYKGLLKFRDDLIIFEKEITEDILYSLVNTPEKRGNFHFYYKIFDIVFHETFVKQETKEYIVKLHDITYKFNLETDEQIKIWNNL